MQIEKQRLDFIDYAKAIGIILVVVGHINTYNSFCKVWVFAFHMPLFFLVGGMFLKPTTDIKSFIAKKFRRVLIPYFVWGLIFAEFTFKNLLCVFYGSQNTLFVAHSLSSLWFFTVLFLAYIICEIVVNATSKGKGIILKLLMGGVGMTIGFLLPRLKYGYPWGLNIAFVAFGFMMIGKCVFDVLMQARTMSSWRLMIVVCLLVVGTLGSSLNREINMANSVYGSPILFLLFALIGCAFVLCLSMLIERVNMWKVNTWLLYLGQNSLTIMLLHKPIISIFANVFARASLPNGVCLLFITLFTIIISCAVTAILNKFVPQIVGRDGK